ncbi:hypothetical protein BJX99DRAFT_34604 [Aspergillus californicus]
MLPSQLNSSPKRANPFSRASPSPSPSSSPQTKARPKSAVIATNGKFEEARGHFRNSSSVSHVPPLAPFTRNTNRQRSNSLRNDVASGTFAPEFIKSEDLRRGADQIRGQEGDNDFSGNKYVWLRDPERAFIKGLVLEERDGGGFLVQTDDGQVRANTSSSSLRLLTL